MSLNLLILILCYAAMICTLIFLPQNTKKIVNKAGTLLYSLKNKNNLGFYAVCIVAFALVFLLFFQQVTLYTVIIDLCAVFGLFIVTKEWSLKKVYGVYQNLIIINSTVLEYSDIVTFPILNLPKEEQEHYQKNVLVVATESKGNINLIFETDDDCSKVIQILTEQDIIKE